MNPNRARRSVKLSDLKRPGASKPVSPPSMVDAQPRFRVGIRADGAFDKTINTPFGSYVRHEPYEGVLMERVEDTWQPVWDNGTQGKHLVLADVDARGNAIPKIGSNGVPLVRPFAPVPKSIRDAMPDRVFDRTFTFGNSRDGKKQVMSSDVIKALRAGETVFVDQSENRFFTRAGDPYGVELVLGVREKDGAPYVRAAAFLNAAGEPEGHFKAERLLELQRVKEMSDMVCSLDTGDSELACQV